MWWNHAGWGPMYGWWIMPIFGLLCMVFVIFFISRISNRDGRGCAPFGQGSPRDVRGENELLNEVKALRREVDELRQKQEEQ